MTDSHEEAERSHRQRAASRFVFVSLVTTLYLGASACNTVEFYQKGALADPTMQYAESPAQLHWQQKVQYSDEGAAGGIGTSAGGGCGCY